MFQGLSIAPQKVQQLPILPFLLPHNRKISSETRNNDFLFPQNYRFECTCSQSTLYNQDGTQKLHHSKVHFVSIDPRQLQQKAFL